MTDMTSFHRECKDCGGTGKCRVLWEGYDNHCRTCYGAGQMPPVDEAAIRAALVGRGGVIVRTSPPCKGKRDTIATCRAYYVWRMARFHGGADVTMPMVAMLFSGDDSFKDELDALADTIAREMWGTDLAAATRWGRALGYL